MNTKFTREQHYIYPTDTGLHDHPKPKGKKRHVNKLMVRDRAFRDFCRKHAKDNWIELPHVQVFLAGVGERDFEYLQMITFMFERVEFTFICEGKHARFDDEPEIDFGVMAFQFSHEEVYYIRVSEKDFRKTNSSIEKLIMHVK